MTWASVDLRYHFLELDLRETFEKMVSVEAVGKWVEYMEELVDDETNPHEGSWLLPSSDGGETWENLSHGLYMNDDLVDMHGVMASSLIPGTVLSISRAGLFRSEDHGDHWTHIDLQGGLNEKGHTYSRGIREVPGDNKTVWGAAGANFQSELGALYRSKDVGATWEHIELGFDARSTMFGIAFDEHQRGRMYCATGGGQVFGSLDRGESWNAYPLPAGATQVYSLACG